ncbi:ATP-binding protein [Cytobacillus dafuensis]|uniref:histidine kinase n=1 Tax=Cytobacillus dafuensis TaxID=1742359 RepID=A0A5B8Z6B0_CYTDA|nr:ATP-binding protein [Cytobacillus dafuensis]QED46926.1 sensor histidine kinase [Cytobacillus dafuensis]
MGKKNINFLLIHEEKRALKIYITSFYITYVLSDFIYYFFYPKYILKTAIGYPNAIGYWGYLIFIGLIPIAYFLAKIDKLSAIKYMYLLSYIIFSIISDAVLFADNPSSFNSGNAVELILVLFSPIFINKQFYWVVTLGSILRYLLVGIMIKSGVVLIPIVLIIILSAISYILLRRFSSYIHALHNSHEDLRQMEKLAYIGQIAATISHEIKNPLASLKGFTQLQREKHPSDQHYYLIMEQEIVRINSIVNDLLILGKPKSTHFEKHNVRDILTYVLSITQLLALKKKIKLSSEMEEDLPLIECDENQLKQVFINLIKNGIDSMQDGGNLRILSKFCSNNQVSISFSDQGCGIDQSDLDNLFKPFYTTKEDGTGLGLIVTKKIIEDHQGFINVESELNIGTRIDIILPISQ